MKNPIVQAIAFDLDGTLIDSTDAIVESFFYTFLVKGYPVPSRDAIVSTISLPLEDQFARLANVEPAECARIYRDFYRILGPAKTAVLPGVLEALEQLRTEGIYMGVTTSKSRPAAEMLLARLGIDHYFDWCIGPEDVRNPKPHPEPVYKSLERFGVPAGAMAFVGDTAFDLRAAQAAGVRCFGVATGYASRDELLALGPERVFDSLSELAGWLVEELRQPAL